MVYELARNFKQRPLRSNNMTALQQVNNPAAQYIDLDLKSEIVPINHKAEEHGKKQKYKAIQASISAPLAQIGAIGTGNASLTFVEYTDKKNNWHRKITPQNLKDFPNVHSAFFNALTHDVKIYAQKVAAPTQNNQALKIAAPEAAQINDKDLKISAPKRNKLGVIELVASSALVNGCKIAVTQDKKGVSEIVVSRDNKAKKDAKNVQADAVINTIQQRCLAKIAQFIKENEGKKIEKPVQKKEGKAPKAEKAGHAHKAKHAQQKEHKHADGKKHHHGHNKH